MFQERETFEVTSEGKYHKSSAYLLRGNYYEQEWLTKAKLQVDAEKVALN